MQLKKLTYGLSLLIASFVAATSAVTPVSAQQQPNIVVIMGDDIGWFNIGAYHRGIMAGRTPNLDQLAAEGMLFTDYYAEASCTAGRANFITGQLPIRTGLTTVGQAGSPIGMPAEAPTIATALKSMGYATGQFGKNHLGDLNEFLPTVHGFDEFFGYLYHLDAMEDPCHRNYPQDLKDTVGPRNMVHTWATDVDDPTVQPRWGKIGKQKIEDAGDALSRSAWRRWTTRSSTIALKFVDKAKADGKPFFLWLNPTRMHVVTHLSRKVREACATPENGWSDARSRHGAARRHRRLGHEVSQGQWASTTTPSSSSPPTTAPRTSPGPMAARRRSPAARERRWKAASACRLIVRWPGKCPGRQGRERHRLRPRLVPDLRRRGRQPEHRRGAEEGQEARRRRPTRSISTATTRST